MIEVLQTCGYSQVQLLTHKQTRGCPNSFGLPEWVAARELTRDKRIAIAGGSSPNGALHATLHQDPSRDHARLCQDHS